MTRTTFAVPVVFLCIAATAPEVIFVSPCECQGFHGKNRWVTKTDLSPVPLDKSVDSIRYAFADLRMGRARAGCGFEELYRGENAVRAKMVRTHRARR